jgi:glycosyltransferase involved in cell wall biosynthesis
MTRVLVVTQDRLGAEMGGNAIRAAELAGTLAPYAAVTLAGPGSPPPCGSGAVHVPFDPTDPRALQPLIREADVVVSPPQSAVVSAWLRRTRARVVYDLYDPQVLEILDSGPNHRFLRQGVSGMIALDQLLEALHGAHYLLCAGERQRDLWIGALLANRLITRSVYRRDPTLRSVIDVVAFGVPERPPDRLIGAGWRDRFQAIDRDDEIVLWNGGIWNWLDPETAIRAVAHLTERRPGVRLVFMGRPPGHAHMAATATAAQALAARLGLLDGVVFFNDRWVPYREREAWLLDADCALSTHRDHLESRFSFRTRLLDCFWAGIPVVCTSGDELSSRVASDDLGVSVPPGDVPAAADALEHVLERGREAYAPQLARVAADYAWSSVAKPLIRYVSAPPATDRLGHHGAARVAGPARRTRSAAIRVGRRVVGRLR